MPGGRSLLGPVKQAEKNALWSPPSATSSFSPSRPGFVMAKLENSPHLKIATLPVSGSLGET